MPGRMYSIAFAAVDITAAQDLFAIQAADDKPCVIHGFKVAVVGGTADAGDAQEELLSVTCRRGFTSIGSGGTAPTPVALVPSDAAAGFTAHVNDTTPASGGTGTLIDADGLNNRMGLIWIPTPELRPMLTQGQTTFVVQLVVLPADSIKVNGTMWVEELG